MKRVNLNDSVDQGSGTGVQTHREVRNPRTGWFEIVEVAGDDDLQAEDQADFRSWDIDWVVDPDREREPWDRHAGPV